VAEFKRAGVSGLIMACLSPVSSCLRLTMKATYMRHDDTPNKSTLVPTVDILWEGQVAQVAKFKRAGVSGQIISCSSPVGSCLCLTKKPAYARHKDTPSALSLAPALDVLWEGQAVHALVDFQRGGGGICNLLASIPPVGTGYFLLSPAGSCLRLTKKPVYVCHKDTPCASPLAMVLDVLWEGQAGACAG
jgi:hypothetical protein